MKRIILSAVFAGVFCLLSDAQTLQKKDTFSSFTGLKVSHNFVVTLTSGPEYSATLDVDARIADYSRMYLQGSTLVLDVDEKNFPKELKAQIRKAGASTIVAVATVTVPDGGALQSITLSDNAALSCSHSFRVTKEFSVNMEGNSKITSLTVNSTNGVEVKTEKNAQLSAVLSAPKIRVNSSGSSKLYIEADTKNMDVHTSNSSKLTLKGSAASLSAETAGGSEITFTGEARTFKHTGKGNSHIDALTARIEDADLSLSGADCDVNASKTLKIKAEGGAKIIFAADPVINIDKITNSSVSRSTDPGNRKR